MKIRRLSVLSLVLGLVTTWGMLGGQLISGGPQSAVPVETGGAAAGEVLFFGKAACQTCHEVNGRGGVVGPDLSGAGRLSAAALRRKIVDPNNSNAGEDSGAAPVAVAVKTKAGRDIRGVRRNEDTFSLQMVDASGTLHLLDKLQLASVVVEKTSIMPSDYGTKLSASEIASLVSYLRTLKERDPSQTSSAPPAPGGVNVRTALECQGRAAELAHVLG